MSAELDLIKGLQEVVGRLVEQNSILIRKVSKLEQKVSVLEDMADISPEDLRHE